MPGLAKVIVVDPDARAGRQVQLGFEREGVPTQMLVVPVDPARLELPAADADEAGLVIVGGHAERGLELLRRVRGLLDADHLDTPLLFAGGSVRRMDAERAGADEVVLQPAYLRDVVTIGRLLRNVASHQRSHITGSLAEMSGVLTLVRALSALGRSAVLTLMRGLRRGEVRFFEGEVTSAQVGLIHGQAALHQLLLWTDARFEFHYEDIVRRQQIPLEGEELWADAEGFLAGVRDAAGQLSPSIVLEQDVPRVHSLGKQIPPEVHGVLRMFDGHRMLADVLEDSPYRVFETLRVTQRAVDAGLLRVTSQGKSKATWRAVLSIEEWLVGGDAPKPVVETPARPRRESQSGRSRTKRRANTPIAIPVTDKGIDWGQLVPRSVGAEVGPLAGVVPAAQRSGEISLPATREAPREKLESLMDTGARARIFPRDLGMEPSIVLDDPSGRIKRASSEATRALEEDEWEHAELEARRRVAETGEHPPLSVHALPTEQLAPLAPAGDADVTVQRVKVEAEPAVEDSGARVEVAAAPAVEDSRARAQRVEVEAAPAVEDSRARARPRNTDPRELVRQLVREETDRELDVTVPRERIVLDPSSEPVDARTEPRVLVSPESAPISSSGPRAKTPTLRPMASVRPDSQPTRAKAPTAPAVDVRTKPPTIPPSLPGLAEPRAKTPTAPPALPGIPEPRSKPPTTPPALPGIPEVRAKSPTAPPAIPDVRAKTPTIPDVRAKTPTAPPAIPDVRAKTPTAPPAILDAPPAIAPTPPHEPRAKTPAAPPEILDAPPALAQTTPPAILDAPPALAQTTPPAILDAPPAIPDPRAKAPAIPDPRAKTPTAPPPDARAKTPTAPPAIPDARAKTSTAPPAIPDARAKTPTAPTSERKRAQTGPPSERKRAQTNPPSERKRAQTHPPSERGRKRTGKSQRASSAPPAETAQDAVTNVRPAPVRAESPAAEEHPFIATPRVMPPTGPIGVAKHPEPAMEPIEDEPSDGVVRPIEGETSSRPMPPPPKLDVVDDRPAAKTGEISSPGMRKRDPSAPPPDVEPSILIHDLSTIHDAVAAVATAQAAAPPTPDAKSAVQEGLVSAVRKDATGAFTKAEEDFFREGYEQEKQLHRAPVTGETFDDLDDGYQPSGFWDRLRGKKKKKKR